MSGTLCVEHTPTIFDQQADSNTWGTPCNTHTSWCLAVILPAYWFYGKGWHLPARAVASILTRLPGHTRITQWIGSFCTARGCDFWSSSAEKAETVSFFLVLAVSPPPRWCDVSKQLTWSANTLLPCAVLCLKNEKFIILKYECSCFITKIDNHFVEQQS